MLKRSQVVSLCNKFPEFADQTLSLRAAPKIPKGLIRETEEIVAYCRKFNEEVARPLSLKLDRKTYEDPNYFPWELAKKVNEWGFYTMWVPKAFGGKGYNMASLSYAAEELASCDLGISNVICVHYLGVASLMMTGEAKINRKILNEVAQGEKSGAPCMIALAITEPTAGTDVEEIDLEDKGKITCHARKVKGGYIVNGSKIFISMGHLSKWTVLVAYTDLKKASETTVVMMVKDGMEGFTFGTHENKMGQRICPASVLNFEDCFVPDELVLLDPARVKTFTKKPVREVKMQYIDYVVTTTRPGVGALATGAARGAYEAALKYVNETEIDGRPMSQYEWVQCRLAEMYTNVRLARLGFEDANYASQLYGMLGLVQSKGPFYFQKYAPKGYFDNVIAPMLDKPGATRLMSRLYYDKQKPKDQHICTGLASLAKFNASDLASRNCQMAIELMGQVGLRHENRVEKILCDAKLLQIYEGTNQLNRLNLFKSLIAPACPQAKIFEA